MKVFVEIICLIVAIFLFSSCERNKEFEFEPEADSITSTTNNNIETSVSPEPMADGTDVKKSHSYGVAKNGVANEISVNTQKYFDENNFNALCLDTRSEGKRLYLTFDCGYENGYTSKILDILLEKNVTAAFFCTLSQVMENPELVKRMIDEGHIVGNHSVTHPSFAEITTEQMREEIVGMEKYLKEKYNYSEPYFRFPKGEYTDQALNLVDSLGYSSVFWSLTYDDWDLTNQKGENYAYDKVISRLHSGAIILLHSVSPDNANALSSIIDEARQQGYTFYSLRDFPTN